MSDKFNVSFEILHLITVISNRFDIIFYGCGLRNEQMYVLAYISTYGQDYVLNDKTLKIFQRPKLVSILQDIFGCDVNKANSLINEIESQSLIRKRVLSSEEKMHFFGSGRNTVYFVTLKGEEKLMEVVEDLKKLLNEILSEDLTILQPPFSNELGSISKGILNFLRYFSTPPDSDAS